MYPESLERLIAELKQLPSVGQKTAERLAYHILKATPEEAMRLAERAHAALGCRGVTRTDFRYDEERGRIIVLEVNTQPGMTPTSLVPEQAANKGIPFTKLVRWMVEDASCDR